jgi:hypothetical protein
MDKEKFLKLMSKAYDEKARVSLHFIYLKNKVDFDLLNELQDLSIEAVGNNIEEQSNEHFDRVLISNKESRFFVSISSEVDKRVKEENQWKLEQK